MDPWSDMTFGEFAWTTLKGVAVIAAGMFVGILIAIILWPLWAR